MKIIKICGFALAILILVGLLLWVTATPRTEALSRPVLPADAPAQDRGVAAFVGAGFGGISQQALERNAVPWKLVAASLVLEEQRSDPSAKIDQATLRRVLQRFGFLFPDKIVNLPAAIKLPKSNMALGMTWGEIAPIGGSKVLVSNLGCAACHSGVTYAADGSPKPDDAMLGTANSSINLEAYTQAVYTALNRHVDTPDLMQAVQSLFPDTDWRERASLRHLVLPLANSRLKDLKALGRPSAFPNGSPGNTNGVAALKLALSAPLIEGGPGDKGFVSIPDLGARAWRSTLLVDGAYQKPGSTKGQAITAQDIDTRHVQALAAITSFFTVPSMGVHPDDAQDGIGDARDIFAWLQHYRAQPFPGAINVATAKQGSAVYAKQCASCHGDYRWTENRPELVRFPNWIGDIGTDPLRASAFDQELAAALANTRYKSMIQLGNGAGYAAPPLAGLWTSAPYLHNGSIPSLAALLSPGQRPAKFMVGGHALDLNSVGIRIDATGRYSSGYVPFATPYVFDTSVAGQGNTGHAYGSTLSSAERQALIEYLKLL